MTAEQRAYVTAHPNFWIQREPKGESSNGNDTFKAANVLNLGADGAGGKKTDNKSAGGGKYSQEANATADRIKKLCMGRDDMEVNDTGNTVKQEPANDQNAERQRHPSCVPHLKTDIGKVFCGWSYVNCPYFKGDHLAGIRLLQGKAYADYKDSCGLETDPLSWEEFVVWVEDLNPITLLKQVVSDKYDALRQGTNESCQAFFDRFREWQSRAKNYGFQYEETSGFVGRLNRSLNNRLVGLMAVEHRRGTPMSFAQVVMAALDEDRRWRKTQTVNTTASGSKSNKRLSDDGDGKPKKKATSGCFNCGKEGHISAKCTEPKTKKQKAYKAAKGAKSYLNVYSVEQSLLHQHRCHMLILLISPPLPRNLPP
ncbi:hypothetical protein PCANC_12161 [Puccinia coronata f. sp. avenae]|uniref:CCHC-type domain-containing protein n=1 Tax=Puccinia coronata f. sp. avenae TaxID=200324 RepID=A0A2N5VGH6_9BASI|nr:hypothetical protein PCANC_12161 [Puccinia coronata f. sp. avenae]